MAERRSRRRRRADGALRSTPSVSSAFGSICSPDAWVTCRGGWMRSALARHHRLYPRQLALQCGAAERRDAKPTRWQRGTKTSITFSVDSERLVPLHRGFDRLAPEAVRSGKGCSRQNGARDEDSARITQEDQAWDQTNDLMAHLASTGQNLCAEVLVQEAGR